MMKTYNMALRFSLALTVVSLGLYLIGTATMVDKLEVLGLMVLVAYAGLTD